MRYVELPDSIIRDIRDFSVMRSNPQTIVRELSDRYEYLVAEVTQRVEDLMYDQWLEGEVEVGVNPVKMREASTQLAEMTIDVYLNKIEGEAAEKVLRHIFNGDNKE